MHQVELRSLALLGARDDADDTKLLAVRSDLTSGGTSAAAISEMADGVRAACKFDRETEPWSGSQPYLHKFLLLRRG